VKFHSISHNVSCQSNLMTDANVFSMQCLNHGVLFSSLSKTKDEASVFYSREPLIFCEETMELKTPKAQNPPQLELPMSSMESVFNQQIGTPYALLSSPPPFQIPVEQYTWFIK
jgi:hypothetical protein